MASLDSYEGFTSKVEAIRTSLLSFLQEAKADNKSVVAYGAAAKGNTLLNYCGVTADDILFAVDANPAKQGTLLPGSHIPVQSPQEIRSTSPDYLLILPWNLVDEIRAQTAYISDWNGRHVVAIPELKILP